MKFNVTIDLKQGRESAGRPHVSDIASRREITLSVPCYSASYPDFGNPYAVIHRVDVHRSLLEDAQETGHVTRLGAAAQPTTQYVAQGACMALEDAVTLDGALRVNNNDSIQAFGLCQRSRVARTARIVLSAREMGRIYHAKGVARRVRNDPWQGRTPEHFYDAMGWLYGWRVDNCLAAA